MSASGGGVLVHATSVVLAAAARPFGGPENTAVLLLGEAGSGKSDLALRLIAAGARLIADDQTMLSVAGGRLWAEAPGGIRGLIEIRGAGIVRLDPADRAPVGLAVRLRPAGGIVRLPEPANYLPPAPLKPLAPPPLIELDPFEASAAPKVAAAASAAVLGRFLAGAAEPKSA